MEIIIDVIQSNLIEIIATVFVTLSGFIGAKIKKLYEEHCNDETKRKVVKTVVNAVEQLYKDLDGNEKLLKAQESITEMLNEKGITITDLEMKMMIEEVCNSFKKGLESGE